MNGWTIRFSRAAFGALLFFHVPPARTPSRAAAFAGGPCVHAPQGGRPGSRAFVRFSRTAFVWAVGGPRSPTTAPRWGRRVCGVVAIGPALTAAGGVVWWLRCYPAWYAPRVYISLHTALPDAFNIAQKWA